MFLQDDYMLEVHIHTAKNANWTGQYIFYSRKLDIHNATDVEYIDNTPGGILGHKLIFRL